MSLKILIVPDKFKGTLLANEVAQAIRVGWEKSRPRDRFDLLPMSDGGDGFGDVLRRVHGARPQKIATVNAAHEPIQATWWWDGKTKTAIIESAKIIGLAMLPPKKFHPYQLDTFGLGKVLQAAAKRGAKKCLVGIGGSATNDGGFGMARALGWRFLDGNGEELEQWIKLPRLMRICPPPRLQVPNTITVAVDVQNPLLGKRGCSQIYGPQKGLLPEDIPTADRMLKRLSQCVSQTDSQKTDLATTPGAGAAGGLGFGLMAFGGAEPQSGFEIFAAQSDLAKRISNSDLVITGEGALDQQTLMGKGVGQVAMLSKEIGVRCIGLAGIVTHPKKAKRLFFQTRALTDIADIEDAKRRPAALLQKIAAEVAASWIV